MAAVCFYFQVHQPYRLRRYNVFDTATDYFDTAGNAAIVQKIAANCYLPANRILLDHCHQYGKQFRVAFSITGTALEQFQAHAPEVLHSFQALAQTGQVEFLGETYYHSLALFYSPEEFRAQVQQHQRLIHRLFQQTPRVFRHTELIYNNIVAQAAQQLGFRAVLAEGWEGVLAGQSPGHLYQASGLPLSLLLRNYQLSDDIAYRFSRRDWPEWPLTAQRFAQRIRQLSTGPLCNLFLDYETWGEHQNAATGILAFLHHLPAHLLKAGHEFITPSQALTRYQAVGELNIPYPLSWADEQRDLSAWLGNTMQTHALHELFQLEAPVKEHPNPALLSHWRKLTTSDHFYYMSTKHHADGNVHAYFSPYESPYDAYINFMNVLQNLRQQITH